ncbi:hypothetical protein BDN71DRAFT_1512986 [Pleurotus eryngii]|uniref:Uncharacterized protein n=1 Tax=Pleurotus eryngii TaxID=5323 RepID=A0A9P5ZJ90_PLEER|nr:hypothetical protein BDN71DRAFT_1512986 [Pleurotus eryngii]
MNTPEDLTTEALKVAKSAKLKKWIWDANSLAKRHVLNTMGKVQELRQQLAEFYHLDLSVPELVVPTDVKDTNPIDIMIQNRQWDYLMELRAEWKELSAAGWEFKLV